MAEVSDGALLRDYFSDDEPLGQISASDTINRSTYKLMQQYFDKDNFLYKQMRRNPSMIVGRKGAGKTEFLKSILLSNEDSVIVYFDDKDAANQFNIILDEIEAGGVHSGAAITEQVARLWNVLFWIALFDAIRRNVQGAKEDLHVLSRYLDGLNVPRKEVAGRGNPYDAVLSAATAMKLVYLQSDEKKAGISFWSTFHRMAFNDLTFSDALASAENILRENNKEGYILFDSIEEIDLVDTRHHLLVSGLLKCIGEFYRPGQKCRLRACIPAESYFYLLGLSSNVLKDFQHSQILHWHAAELLHMAAMRLSIYIRIKDPNLYNTKIQQLDLRVRKDLMEFWSYFLPERIVNGAKLQERTIPYILRHTQLLPRHILLCLNSCFSQHIARGKTLSERLSAQDIIEGVKTAEHAIAQQIVKSYGKIWPDAMEAIIDLLKIRHENTVSFSDIQKIYHKQKKYTYVSSFQDYIRMLTEVGLIGRFIYKTNEYIEAKFEYSEASKLIISPTDVLCIHPVFSEIADLGERIAHDAAENYLPIYPRGIDPEDIDTRPQEQASD